MRSLWFALLLLTRQSAAVTWDDAPDACALRGYTPLYGTVCTMSGTGICQNTQITVQTAAKNCSGKVHYSVDMHGLSTVAWDVSETQSESLCENVTFTARTLQPRSISSVGVRALCTSTQACGQRDVNVSLLHVKDCLGFSVEAVGTGGCDYTAPVVSTIHFPNHTACDGMVVTLTDPGASGASWIVETGSLNAASVLHNTSAVLNGDSNDGVLALSIRTPMPIPAPQVSVLMYIKMVP